MRIERRYTTAGQSPYRPIAFRRATSEIRNPDGSLVFRLDGIEAPEAWSQVAVDVLAQKYFRKAGVPARLSGSRRRRAGVAVALGPGRAALAAFAESRSARRPRLARCSTGWPAAGRTGAGRAATSRRRRTPGRSTTRCATCWPTQMAAPN